jgi:DHA1 family multidrug resistance protein-like MFS transporter
MPHYADDRRKGLAILLIFTFFMAVGFDMIMPLIIGHYVNDVGFTATAVAVALAVRQFSQQGLALVGGGLADRFDIRTLIGLGVLLRAIGFAALAFASNYAILLMAMVLIGLGGVLFEMPYQSAIALLTTEKNRSRYYSLNNTVSGVAGAIGPLIGVALLRFDFVLVCFGAAFCFLINFVISCFAMPRVMRSEPSYPILPAIKAIARDKSYLTFVLLMVIFWLAASQIDFSYPLKIQEITGNADGVGVMYAVYAVVYGALQYPLVALSLKKFSPRQSVAIGIAVIAAALIFTAFVKTTIPFMALVGIYALGMLLARPNQQNIAVSMAEPRALGMYLGVNSMAFAIGKGFGTILGGAAFDLAKKAGAEALPWYLFTAVALVSMFGFTLCKRIGQPRAAADRQEK